MQCTYTAAYSCTALKINSSRDQILSNATNFLTIKGGSIKKGGGLSPRGDFYKSGRGGVANYSENMNLGKDSSKFK